ncbi:5-oxoprolinase subunit PxpA [Reinekea sp.]|uniref:5-oxoprolinase subunit PxpA n=1 Tax=Reinekea sp. TaxID=1970455 RepID=UPI0039893FAF
MLLNCDLGESYGQWQLGNDAEVMPHIDMANIACGFHAGDPTTLANTIALAKQHQVSIGAHPSYPDLAGFGRRSMKLTTNELTQLMHYQIAALEGMAKCQSMSLSYVKPHGALYNDMMADEQLLRTLLQAVASYPSDLKFMLMSTAAHQKHRELANSMGIELLFEVFADRRYTEAGLLMPRSEVGALLNTADMLEQVTLIATKQKVITADGSLLQIPMDSLCVHGDNPTAVAQIKQIRKLVTP